MLSWLADLARVYGRTFQRAAELLVRNWPLPVVALGYQLITMAAGVAIAPLQLLGQFGGFAAGVVAVIVGAACMSSWLALVEQVIRSGRIAAAEVRTSFTTYLGDLLNVGFLLFGLQLVGEFALTPFPYLKIVFLLATAVFLNAVPELLYLGHHAGVALFVESYRFIGQSWIEWFPANIVLLALLGAVLTGVPEGPFGLLGAAAFAIAMSYALLVRGLLFLELTTSSRRAREFRRRVEG